MRQKKKVRSNGTRTIRNAKLHSREVLHPCCRAAVNVTSTDRRQSPAHFLMFTVLTTCSDQQASPLQTTPWDLLMSAEQTFRANRITFSSKRLSQSKPPSLPVKYNHAIIHTWDLFNRYLLSAYHRPATVPGAGDTAVIEAKNIFVDFNILDLSRLIYGAWYQTYVTISGVFSSCPQQNLNFTRAKRVPHSFLQYSKVNFSMEPDSAIWNPAWTLLDTVFVPWGKLLNLSGLQFPYL